MFTNGHMETHVQEKYTGKEKLGNEYLEKNTWKRIMYRDSRKQIYFYSSNIVHLIALIQHKLLYSFQT